MNPLRPALAGIGKGTVLFPSAFLAAVGEGMLALGLVFFMRQVYGASAGLIGTLVASGTLVYVVGCLLVRPLFDRVRPRFLLIGAAAAMALTLGLLILVRSIPLTFLLLALNKLATGLFWPPAMGWISHGYEGKALNRQMSRYNLSWSCGLALSPLPAGFLSERSASWALAVTVGVDLLVLLLVGAAALLLPGIRADGYREQRGADPVGEGPDRSTFLRFPAWVGLFTSYVAGGMLFTIFPIFARDTLLLREGLVGGLLSVRVVFQAAGFLALGRLSFWHFRGRYALFGQLFLALVLAALIVGRAPVWIGALFALLGLAAAFHYANSLFHGVSGSLRRARRMAIHEALLTGGQIAGSAAGGMLLQHASMRAVYLFCIGCTGLGVLAQGALLAAWRRRAAAAAAPTGCARTSGCASRSPPREAWGRTSALRRGGEHEALADQPVGEAVQVAAQAQALVALRARRAQLRDGVAQDGGVQVGDGGLHERVLLVLGQELVDVQLQLGVEELGRADGVGRVGDEGAEIGEAEARQHQHAQGGDLGVDAQVPRAVLPVRGPASSSRQWPSAEVRYRLLSAAKSMCSRTR